MINILKLRNFRVGDVLDIEGRKFLIIKTLLGTEYKGWKRYSLKLLEKVK